MVVRNFIEKEEKRKKREKKRGKKKTRRQKIQRTSSDGALCVSHTEWERAKPRREKGNEEQVWPSHRPLTDTNSFLGSAGPVYSNSQRRSLFL